MKENEGASCGGCLGMFVMLIVLGMIFQGCVGLVDIAVPDRTAEEQYEDFIETDRRRRKREKEEKEAEELRDAFRAKDIIENGY